jgi:hypothetical protein
MPEQNGFYYENECYLNTFELEDIYGFRSATWRRWLNEGRFKSAKQYLGHWMVLEGEVQQFMEAYKKAHPMEIPYHQRTRYMTYKSKFSSLPARGADEKQRPAGRELAPSGAGRKGSRSLAVEGGGFGGPLEGVRCENEG